MKHENEMKMAHKQKCPTIEEMATPKVRVPGCLDGAKALSHRLRGREVEMSHHRRNGNAKGTSTRVLGWSQSLVPPSTRPRS